MTVPARPPSPLRTPMFRAFWIAGLLSHFGSWVHLVAAAWLMTTLTTSTAPVALLITATSTPTFLLSLHAGALADVVDRRVLITVTQFAQAVLAAVLGVLTITVALRPTVLHGRTPSEYGQFVRNMKRLLTMLVGRSAWDSP